MDVFPRVRGKDGISISWLYTSPTAKVYRIYKYDPAKAFTDDASKSLLREVQLSTAECGLTFRPDTFHDTTTGSEPGIEVGYAIVPLEGPDSALVESTDKAGVFGFIVTWWGDIRVKVEAEGGGPVEEVIVKLSRLVSNYLDPAYTVFFEGLTDEFGEAVLEVRVQDRAWSSKTQHFRVEVEKTSPNVGGGDLVHEFELSSQDVEVGHLLQGTLEFTDTTASIISGTVSHAGFDAEWFAAGCPHTRRDDPTDCMCPVDGATLLIQREGAAQEEPVTLNDGKFSTAVVRGETVTLRLGQ